MRTAIRLALTVLLASALGAVPVCGASAAPPDVEDFAQRQAAGLVRQLASGRQAIEGVPVSPLRGKRITVGTPVTVLALTEDFYMGRTDVEAFEDSGTWIAPVLADDVPAATVLIWRDGSKPALAELSEDAALATDLVTLDTQARLVHDAPIGTWFVSEGDTLRPLGMRTGPAVNLREHQQAAVAYVSDALAQGYDPSDPSAGGADYLDRGGRGASVMPALLVMMVGAGCVAVAVLVIPSRRRPRCDAPD